jgi:hypothetical protein
MYDMWTDAFAVPGQRTSGTDAGDWAVIPPGWRGYLLVAGAGFADLDPAVRGALHDVPAAAMQAMQQAFPRLAKVINGWQMNIDTMGVYGNFYLKRAVVALVGLGANAAEDAVYPILMADLLPRQHGLGLALEVDVGVAADVDGDALDRAAGEGVRVLAG